MGRSQNLNKPTAQERQARRKAKANRRVVRQYDGPRPERPSEAERAARKAEMAERSKPSKIAKERDRVRAGGRSGRRRRKR